MSNSLREEKMKVNKQMNCNYDPVDPTDECKEAC